MTEKAIKLKTKIITCQYVDKITKEKSKPFKHFITDMIQGILSTKSTCLSTITDTIQNENATKASKVSRLSKNLKQYNFSTVKENEWNYYQSITDDDLYIFLDKSDIINPHQEKSENNYYTTDGSDNYTKKLGYDTSNFLCMTKNHHPLLLYNSVNDRNKWTQKQEEKSIITDLDNYFSNKHRIYVGDSNYSDCKMLKILINQNDSFLMRLNILKGKRKIHVNNMKYNTNDLIELQKECTTKTFQSKYKNKYGTATISKIEGTITGLETPLTFIIATFENSESMVFITNLNCFNLDDAIKLYHKYMERWTIEDVFKCLKTEYQLENYTFRKFQSIQNLLHLLRFVFNILSSMLNKKEFCQDVIKIADGIRKNIKFLFQRLSVGIKKVLKNYNSCFFEYF